ncbi:hypothetical protein SSPO_099650 [Streptomyces antimycoticus]|uniref:Uncharacterized protein n=1 Tax=Streptomyces antimycoticus TaxID=68175 RepID=A0A499VM24_9ACTN|nr:hypothetical protein [Streptomyces antimycoticus]BBJ47247.1 hypothetical protein SSPO_099650 [Streptomyces antimycoticus]
MRRTEAAKQLGRFVREHRTDGARRLRQAGIWLMVGAVGTAFGMPVAIASVGTTDGAPGLAGLLLGVGLVGWGLGIWRLVQAFRTREQCFDIHERGFTHRVAGTATVIPWEDVAQVSTSGGDGRPLADARGMGSTCEIRLHSGRRIRVDAFTEDLRDLVAVVHRAVHLGQFPQGRGR